LGIRRVDGQADFIFCTELLLVHYDEFGYLQYVFCLKHQMYPLSIRAEPCAV